MRGSGRYIAKGFQLICSDRKMQFNKRRLATLDLERRTEKKCAIFQLGGINVLISGEML